MKILITDVVHESGINYLKEKGYELGFTRATDPDELIRELQGYDGVIIRGTKFPKYIFEHCPDLKVACKHGAGADNIDVEGAKSLGIRMVYTPVANANSVAEQAMYLILACAKRGVIMQKAARERDYDIRTRIFCDDIAGKTLGLIGIGQISSRLARMAHEGFGMKIMSYDPYVDRSKVASFVEMVDDRSRIFEEADYVSVHLPSTKATFHNVTLDDFKQMKPTAFFINCSRGSVVDEAALITALEEGIICGAGLDVTESEPPEEGNPLLSMDNVVMTPHNAASTKESMYTMSLHAAMGVDAVLSGQEPPWSL